MTATIHSIVPQQGCPACTAGQVPCGYHSRHEVTITFPRTAVCRFYAERNALTLEAEELKRFLRVGQHFFNHMQLGKVVSPANKLWADKLHAADSNTARKMIIERTDWTC